MSDDLFEAARKAMERAYAPYSRFPVGAALRTADGRVFSGCNVEIASYPEGWCAETTAIGRMVMAGGSARIAEVALVAGRMARITPCGGCRQRLAEFSVPSTKLHLCDGDGIVETLTMGEIFPRGFSGEALR